MAILRVLGKHPSGERLKRIESSPQYTNGSFQNPELTSMGLEGASFFQVIRKFMNKPKTAVPSRPIPSVQTDLFKLPDSGPAIVWFGHSSYLIRIDGLHILVDPVFSGHASPFSFFGKSFPGSDAYPAEAFPPIDVMILTHDHYDHLDYETIRKLAPRTRHFYTSLGVGAHLEYWGIGKEKITELDWGESAGIPRGGSGVAPTDGLLTAAPARHFSGRTFKRNQTLWSSFVLKIAGYSLFLGGDSGYGQHFKAIGDQHGPFDLAILESGQYGQYWPHIHMFPEQTVTAALELRTKALLPVHWSKFSLALHDWNEPIRRVVKAAEEKGLLLTTPLIGEIVVVGESYPRTTWWE
jgi:L-ascorbate metabolism protein UlaG (beta-lactamase superfamily)